MLCDRTESVLYYSSCFRNNIHVHVILIKNCLLNLCCFTMTIIQQCTRAHCMNHLYSYTTSKEHLKTNYYKNINKLNRNCKGRQSKTHNELLHPGGTDLKIALQQISNHEHCTHKTYANLIPTS